VLKVFIKFIFYVLYRVIYRVEVVGRENWDPAQPKVVCPNHIDYKDPLVFGTFIPDYIRFMAKKELFSNRLFDWFFRGCGGFPVDRTGNDIGAVKAALRFLKHGESVLIFAEGTRNPGLTPLPPKAGVGMIAHKAGVPIQPVTIDSTYKFFSKVRIIIHPLVTLQFEGKPTGPDYENAVFEILKNVYSHIELYKGRA